MLLITYSFTFLVVFTITIQAKHDPCSDNSTSIQSIDTEAEFNSFTFNCEEALPVRSMDILIYLYNLDNKNYGILLNSNNTQYIDTTKRIIVLLHGWRCNNTKGRFPQLKNAYLERYDCNVITVDWSEYSRDLYGKVFCNIPEVAKIIGKFLCGLKIHLGFIHLVGHSMGAHLSGLIGQEVKKQCKTIIGRITALDPAGPIYTTLTEDRRLDRKDAAFVDVIHTNAGYFGYLQQCGTVDFYPNCGVVQPGCSSTRQGKLKNYLFDMPQAAVACNHIRSLDLMIASIQEYKFYAKRCRMCTYSKRLCNRGNFLMGEDCSTKLTPGKYFLKTSSTYPFAQ